MGINNIIKYDSKYIFIYINIFIIRILNIKIRY